MSTVQEAGQQFPSLRAGSRAHGVHTPARLKMASHPCALSSQIMREIQEHKIKIYEFPETGDEEENRLVKKIKVRPAFRTRAPQVRPASMCTRLSHQDKLPLAVVGSNTIIEVNNKKVRVRQYPWGVAEGTGAGGGGGQQTPAVCRGAFMMSLSLRCS